MRPLPSPSLLCAAPLALLLAACTDPGDKADGGTGSSEEDTAAMVYGSLDPDPVWTADEVGTIVMDTLNLGAPSALAIGEAYADVMAEGEPECPGETTDLSTSPEGCQTSDGYTYAGIAWFNVGGNVEYNGQIVGLSYSHGGDFAIRRPDGTRFAGAGGMAYVAEVQDELIVTTLVDVHGSWVADYRVDWLGRGFSGVYTVELTTNMQESYNFELDGGISVGDVNLYFEDATWDTADACGAAMVGAISLRDDRGYWYRWEITEACSECGELIFHGDQDLGELCMNTQAWGNLMARDMEPPIVDSGGPDGAGGDTGEAGSNARFVGRGSARNRPLPSSTLLNRPPPSGAPSEGTQP